MYSVLVTGVGSNIGQGIVKALRMSSFKCRIIGVDMNPLSAGLYRVDSAYIVPPANREEYIGAIIDISKENHVDIVLIGSDAEVPVLARDKALVEETAGCKVIVSPVEVVSICTDKWLTVRFLEQTGLNYPFTVLANTKESVRRIIDVCGFPLIVKPRVGSGSEGTYKVSDEEELKYHLGLVERPLVQEELRPEDEEYTCGIFLTRDSEVKGIISMRRQLQGGTTYRAIVDHYPEILHEVGRIAHHLSAKGAIGPINVQLKLTPVGAIAFEINPRFSGTTSFRAKLGFNEVEAIIRSFLLKEKIGELRYRSGVVMRYWEEIYTSLDEVKKLKNNGCLHNPDSEVLHVV